MLGFCNLGVPRSIRGGRTRLVLLCTITSLSSVGRASDCKCAFCSIDHLSRHSRRQRTSPLIFLKTWCVTSHMWNENILRIHSINQSCCIHNNHCYSDRTGQDRTLCVLCRHDRHLARCNHARIHSLLSISRIPSRMSHWAQRSSTDGNE